MEKSKFFNFIFFIFSFLILVFNFTLRAEFIRDDILEIVKDTSTNLMWQDNSETSSVKKNWQDVIDYCENLNFAGYDDWRVPNITELISITDKTKYRPAINTNFKYCLNDYIYWTSTSYSVDNNFAWGINYFFGEDRIINKKITTYVRCTRTYQEKLNKSYSRDNNLNIVGDNLTGLMWQDENNTQLLGWREAVNYCENLNFAGYDDWYLPSYNELNSIVDYSRHSSAIDNIFQNTKNTYYWTSTLYGYYTTVIWRINFDNGEDETAGDDSRYFKYNVRCVRVGKLNVTPTLNISSSKINSKINETINFTSTATDTDGTISSYLWDFGDGSSSTEANSTHSYSSLGTYRVTCTITDDKGAIDTKNLSITVSNTSPTITLNSNISTNRNQPISENFIISDLENDIISTTNKIKPSNGILILNSNSYTYTPNSNYEGSDSFTLKFDDGNGGVVEKTILVNINSYNQLPSVTIDESISLDEDSQISKTFSINDSDGDIVTTTIKTYPTNGNLTLENNSYTYKPNANFNGSDSFILSFSDGYNHDSVIQKSINVSVKAINDKPTFLALENLSVEEDNKLTKTLTLNDIDGDSVNISIKTNPLHGTLTLNSTSFTYTPDTNYNGSDTFKLKFDDKKGGVVENSITIEVTPVNDKPILVINSDKLSGKAPFSVNFSANGEDVEDNTLSYFWDFKDGITSNEANPTHTFNKEGNYEVSCKVMDINGMSQTKEITISVKDNKKPIVTSISKEIQIDKSISIELLGNDEDRDNLTYEIVNKPIKGEVSINGSIAIYKANELGIDNFSYRAFDGKEYSNEANIKVEVKEKIDTLIASKNRLYVYKDIDKNLTQVEIFGGKAPYSWSVKEAGEIKYLNKDKTLAYYTPSIIKSDDIITIKSSDGQIVNVSVIFLDKLLTTPKKVYFDSFEGNLTIKISGGVPPYRATTTAGDVEVKENIAIYTPTNRYEKQQVSIRDTSNQESVIQIFVEGGLKITPSNPFLNTSESVKLSGLRGSGNYSWSSEKGTLSNSIGKDVIYTAPQIPTEDRVTLTDSSGSETVAIITVGEADTKILNLNEGWNLASLLVDKNLSYIPNGWTPSEGVEDINILGDFDMILSFENSQWSIYTKGEQNFFELKPQMGFWIKMNSKGSITFKGENYVTDLSKLNEGWSLLGTGKKLTNIKKNFSLQEVWSYKENKWIKNPSIINAGEGFWVKK